MTPEHTGNPAAGAFERLSALFKEMEFPNDHYYNMADFVNAAFDLLAEHKALLESMEFMQQTNEVMRKRLVTMAQAPDKGEA